MITLLRQNRFFFIAYTLLFIAVGILQLVFTQEELIRWVNAHNTVEGDYFFQYATYLGDGVFFVGIILVFFISSRRNGLLALTSFLLSSGLSIFLKQVVFHGRPRPAMVFADSPWKYHVIEGLNIATINSFPSGHTISAFAVFTLFALLDDRKNRGWVFLIPAALVGYSRVYLFQHFAVDVFAGSLIGVLSSVVTGIVLTRAPFARRAG
ncbi:MAG: phosphatase PAP2 family protein [Cytophagales bacterium]|nr:MAG: phosphatase PAP2 family protein [Cytophagales bacterium]